MEDWLLLAKGLRVLPKTPGVDIAPRAVAEDGKKVDWPMPEVPRLPYDWFPVLKLVPKAPALVDPRVLGATPRLRVGGPEPGSP